MNSKQDVQQSFIYICNTGMLLTSKAKWIMKCKRFVVYFYCFMSSNNCYWATAGGSEGYAYLILHDHLFSCLQFLNIPTSDKVYSLLPHPKHCGDLVWCALTLQCETSSAWLVAWVITGKPYVTSQVVTILELFHHLTLFILYIMKCHVCI